MYHVGDAEGKILRLGSGEGSDSIVERSPSGRYIRFGDKLGCGASKIVYRAYDTREGIEVAWNVVTLSGVPQHERNRIVNEVRLLERLHHPNIIRFHGSWVNRQRQEVHFITEILSSGTLKSFIKKVQVIRWKIAKRWLTQILEALQYLHSQGVIHRDLKCDNIFIDGASGDIRIGDMGLCTVPKQDRPSHSVLGTPEFMAPDMYEEHVSYDEKVDIYSFGMCMLEICTHEAPYRECANPLQIYRKVSNGIYPQSLHRIHSPEARNFILLCLGRKDTSGSGRYIRPSAAQLLSHPFLAPNADDDHLVLVDPPPDMSNAATSLSDRLRTSIETPDLVSTSSSSERPQHRGTSMGSTSPSEPSYSYNLSKQSLNQLSLQEASNVHANSKNDLVDEFRDMPQTEYECHQQHDQATQEEQGQQGQPNHHQSNHDAVYGASREKKKMVLNGEQQEGGAVSAKSKLLPLVVTLPVQGHTQHIQFDFDLMKDDPINVATEMVSELLIPQEQMFEISRLISEQVRRAMVVLKTTEQQYQLKKQEEDLERKIQTLSSQIMEQQQQQQKQHF